MPDAGSETFFTLLTNLSHWEFEVLVSVVFAIVEGAVVWPLYKRWSKHHKGDDDKLAELEKRIDGLERRPRA